MVKPHIKMFCSSMSHMPLHFVWRDSGISQKHGFELSVAIVNRSLDGEEMLSYGDRAPKLLDGTFDLLSGLHHETYVYRARGDKRLVYLAQTQNDWDDRVIAGPQVQSVHDVEGKSLYAASSAPCVLGNLKHSLELAGVNVGRVQFVGLDETRRLPLREVVEMVVHGDVAAASVDLPFDLIGEKLGLHRVDIPSVPVIHNTTLCLNREWVLRNEETVLAVLRSLVETIHFFKTQKSRVCEILERTLAPLIDLRTPDELEYLHQGWASLLSAKPYPHPLAVWNGYNLDVAHNPEFSFIGPFEIWDTSYLRAIDDEGFIDSLYGGAKEAANPAVNVAI